MKFLIIDNDYPEFLHWLYNRHPGLEGQPYERQLEVRNDSLFGTSDFYSANLRKLGHEAHDVLFLNEPLQKAWALEHGVKVRDESWQFHWRKGFVPWISRVRGRWVYEILADQIKHYRPDVILNHSMGISSRFLKEVKSNTALLVGQIASPLPQRVDFHIYDVVISSLPNLVSHFRKLGVSSEFNRLGFDPTVLGKLSDYPEVSVSFVGSLTPDHHKRIKWMEYLCARFDVKIWGKGAHDLPESSPILSRFMGPAWGVEMYRILRGSKITLNHHIDMAEKYANNMRLYEATGVGTLLLTDWKENLSEMFEPGREVVAYRSPEECAELIDYYLNHEAERTAIARAGQQHTLRDHTYYQRMQDLAEIVERYL